ncbi:MAG: TonB-dependent receptor [Bacteroidaceae bacterium]|nr:TonB-dependent receptor [Bacteroidaceae bacterium]
MRRYLLLFMLMLLQQALLTAQNITGKVLDEKSQAVEGASVVVQSLDSTFVDVALTASDGSFSIPSTLTCFRLIVQHLSFFHKEVTADAAAVGTIVLKRKDDELQELVVTASRPLVRVENGALAYDVEAMAQNSTANNAYEAILRIPGVSEGADGTLSLAGAGSLTVVLNGRPSSMTAEQLATLLRSTPVERIERADVMYSAPPSFHVRGAVVNVQLKKSNDYTFQGELGANYFNNYNDNYATHANLRMATPKIAFDLMYKVGQYTEAQKMRLSSLHQFDGRLYDIRQEQISVNEGRRHNYRAALEYNWGEGDNLSLAYTGTLAEDVERRSLSDGNYQKSESVTASDYDFMNNVSLSMQLSAGLSAGVDYTLYKSRDASNMSVLYKEAGSLARTVYTSGQKIGSLTAYADRTRPLARGWTLGYGASYKFISTENYQHYSEALTPSAPDIDTELDETTASLYFSAGKQYASGVSFSLSATGEYYKIGDYKKWSFYPQGSLTWMRNPNHILQASLSVDKHFPSYWALQGTVSYLDGYSELHGSPGLRPLTRYNMNVNYIYKQKYVAGLFYIYHDKFFGQTPYQSSERLVLIYKMLNWNYLAQTGVNFVVPVKVGNWLDSRLTLTGIYMHQRCDEYFDLGFVRDNWGAVISLNNSFILCEALSLELNGFMQTPAAQGTFDIPTLAEVTAGARWTFAREKASLTLRWNDIFDTFSPDLSLDYKGQKMSMKNNNYTSYLSLDFVYRFGGYKKREIKEVDTSRFGR